MLYTLINTKFHVSQSIGFYKYFILTNNKTADNLWLATISTKQLSKKPWYDKA